MPRINFLPKYPNITFQSIQHALLGIQRRNHYLQYALLILSIFHQYTKIMIFLYHHLAIFRFCLCRADGDMVFSGVDITIEIKGQIGGKIIQMLHIPHTFKQLPWQRIHLQSPM